MRRLSALSPLVAAGLLVTACQANDELPTPAGLTGDEPAGVSETDMSDETQPENETTADPASDRTTTPASERGPIHTPADGLIRPGGPVNRPVPGLAGAEAWPDLEPEDLAGDWELELTGGFSACTLRLSAVNPAGSGALSSDGACPFGPRTPVRWRYHSGLGQIAMLDETGATVMTAHRRGPHLFTLYSPGVGQMKLTPKA